VPPPTLVTPVTTLVSHLVSHLDQHVLVIIVVDEE
jgi:hypothetical protein